MNHPQVWVIIRETSRGWGNIEWVHCHTIENKIKNNASDKVKNCDIVDNK